MFDPLQINSFLKLVEAFNEKAMPKIRELAFKNMLKYEDYDKKGDVYLMKNNTASDTEIHSATKFSKAGFYVVFPNKEQFNKIKAKLTDISKSVNDIYAYDKISYRQYKIDLKTVNGGSKEAITEHIIKGSKQASNIVIDIQECGISRWNVIKGIREGWSDDTKTIFLNWKGQWYEIDKDKAFGNKKAYRNRIENYIK